jgi:hypothetical protein
LSESGFTGFEDLQDGVRIRIFRILGLAEFYFKEFSAVVGSSAYLNFFARKYNHPQPLLF